MAKRSIVIVTGIILAGICFFLWQHSTTAEPVPGGPAATNVPLAVGASATVYLRGDVTGMSVHDRVVDLSNLVSLKGTVATADEHWLQLIGEGQRVDRIPIPSIAALETQANNGPMQKDPGIYGPK